jgi:hypothetical protein
MGLCLAQHLSTFQFIKISSPLPGDARRFNGRGTRFFVKAFFCLWLLVGVSVAAVAQVNVYTRSYDTSDRCESAGDDSHSG